MIKFKLGKTYTGTGYYGYCDMKVISRTKKTITFETVLGTFRAKIRDNFINHESVSKQAWIWTAV
jgi:hypothetical protein